MLKEIGGYFEFEKLISNEYHNSLLKFNSAGSALLYAIKAYHIKVLYMPYYLPNSLFQMCESAGVMVVHYHINSFLTPVFEKELDAGEYLYLVNYYGLMKKEKILEFKNDFKNIIVDNVQAFFERPVEGVITLYSCRKFFGVPDGGYLSTERFLDKTFERETVVNNTTHLVGRLEESANKYFQHYKENEKKFVSSEIKMMSKFTENMMGGIDYNEVMKKRNENFYYLLKYLGQHNNLELTEYKPNGPFCYPFYYSRGAELRKQLIEKKIYIPFLWPDVDKRQVLEYDFAQNLLQIPCDQRYDTEDMAYIIKEIEKCLN